jgi:Flp pilus assembly protein TadG
MFMHLTPRQASGLLGQHKQRRRAAAALEFAIVAPVFFFLVLGIIEVGRGIMVQQLMIHAARQGCRTAILPGNTNTDVSNTVAGTLSPLGITTDKITVQVNNTTANASTAQSYDEITVIVSVAASDVTWVPGGTFLSGATIQSQYTMRRQ